MPSPGPHRTPATAKSLRTGAKASLYREYAVGRIATTELGASWILDFVEICRRKRGAGKTRRQIAIRCAPVYDFAIGLLLGCV